jgi:hypothetical protein
MNVVSELVRSVPADHLRMCQIGSQEFEGFSLICNSVRNSISKFDHHVGFNGYRYLDLLSE